MAPPIAVAREGGSAGGAGAKAVEEGGDSGEGSPSLDSLASSNITSRRVTGESDQLGPLLGEAARDEPEEDGSDMSFSARLFVFVLFTQLMQALMSYDGGATQMSTQPLLAAGWSSSELGLLGAMDKFGQVATAFVWSHLLMKYSIKMLLAVGLWAKASSCLGFGVLTHKGLMLTAKLGMGVSEALIGVWATVWVQANAPKDSKARWLGFASISAGAGNGAGSAVAGLCSARFGYSFAFVLQAVVLFILWGIMLVTPARFFDFQEESKKEVRRSETTQRYHPFQRSVSTSSELMLQQEIARSISVEIFGGRHASILDEATGGELSFTDSIKCVLKSRLWLFTALAISLSCFVTSAVAYLWQNTTESVWDFSDQKATLSFLGTTGIGGMVGVLLGPKLFDEYLQGFQTQEGRVLCLRYCTYAAGATALLGSVCALLFLEAAWHMVHYEVDGLKSGWTLFFVLSGIFFMFALINSMQGTLYGINTDSATSETKTVAAGLTVSMQNVVGFALGPLLPSLVADMTGSFITREVEPEEPTGVVHSAEFATGMAAAIFVTWLLLLVVHLSAEAAAAPPPRSELRANAERALGPHPLLGTPPSVNPL